jgi:RimJ/RimL family protein N-acetyltransferase
VAALTLRGSTVVLRAFREDEFEQMWRYIGGAGGSRERLEQSIWYSGKWHDGLLYLAVEHSGHFAGAIDAREAGAGVFELGIELIEGARGAGAATEAVVLLTEHLLRTGGVRVEAATVVDNVAMRRVLEKAGFVVDAELPAHWRGRDYVRYARES